MVGVTRVLKAQSVTNPLGNCDLSKEKEEKLIWRYIERAIEILSMDVKKKTIFNIVGVEGDVLNP
jgi:hypothetical protein